MCPPVPLPISCLVIHNRAKEKGSAVSVLSDEVKCACTCGQRISYIPGDAGSVVDCPSCGQRLRLPAQPARAVKRSKGFGPWSMLTALGVLLFVLPGCGGLLVSLPVLAGVNSATPGAQGVALLVAGAAFVWILIGAALCEWANRLRVEWLCSACGNAVGKSSRLCPACRSPLGGQ
jgi:hypothetical protein